MNGARVGLERSCRTDWVRSQPPSDGVQLLQAWFAGRGYTTHRHDTYAIGLTDIGVQAFEYRGVTERSMPGQVVVLHPDEPHDGRAGTADGFGYHIVYVAPSRIADAARAIRGRAGALPFMRAPVMENAALARAIERAFTDGTEPLALDTVIVRLTEGLLAGDPSSGAPAPLRLDGAALARAREFLGAETARVVRSSELEAVAGLTRYDLARQFRAAFGTSPYRYSLLRRLDRARAALRRGDALVDVALDTGFADQAHFSRMFKAAYGVTPARYRALDRR
jgi:AraC-like DNA-binding protein